MRIWLLALAHLAIFALAYWVAFLLKWDFNVPANSVQLFHKSLPWVLATKFALFFLLGQYEGWWRYVTFGDLIALVRTSVLASLAVAAMEYFLAVPWFIPRTILIMDCFCGIVLLGALRGSWRLYREQFWPMFNSSGHRWALLVGTDHSTGMLAHQIQSCRELPYRIRGLLAMNDAVVGSRLGQIPILGRLEDIREIAGVCKATDVLVTAGTLVGSRLQPDERLFRSRSGAEDHPADRGPIGRATTGFPSATSRSATCCGGPPSNWT